MGVATARCSTVKLGQHRSGLTAWDSGCVNNSTVLQQLRWPQRRHTPVTATSEGAGDRPPTTPLETSKAVTAVFPGDPQPVIQPPGSGNHTMHRLQHEAYCRPNLGDILHTRLLRNLILAHEKKFRDLSWSRLVNIPANHLVHRSQFIHLLFDVSTEQQVQVQKSIKIWKPTFEYTLWSCKLIKVAMHKRTTVKRYCVV